MSQFAPSFIWISLPLHFSTVFFVAGFGKQSTLLDETVVGLLGLLVVLFKLSRVACVDAEMSARRPLGQQLCSVGRDFFFLMEILAGCTNELHAVPCLLSCWETRGHAWVTFWVRSHLPRPELTSGFTACLSNVGLRFDGWLHNCGGWWGSPNAL